MLKIDQLDRPDVEGMSANSKSEKPSDNHIINSLINNTRSVPYRPLLHLATGSVTAAILLQQLIYWNVKCKGHPFYKFMEPCDHPTYKPGDSLSEELGFNYHRIYRALKIIGINTGPRNRKKVFRDAAKMGLDPSKYWNKLQSDKFVWFRTDRNRMTWFTLNWELITITCSELYKYVQKQRILLNQKNWSSEHRNQKAKEKRVKELIEKNEMKSMISDIASRVNNG